MNTRDLLNFIDRMRQRLQSGPGIFRLDPHLFRCFSFAYCLTTLCVSAPNAFAASRPETHSEPPTFRYHIPSEPHSLDPSRLTSNDASYFFNNIMRGLFSYSTDEGLRPEGADSCRFEQPLKLVCTLSKDAMWSDGSRVVADDYVHSFRKLLAATSKNPTVELLKKVKNAVAVNAGKTKLEDLGVHADGKNKLIIEFEQPDPEFLYKLTASVLVPSRVEEYPKRGELKGLLFNGPYKVTAWLSGRRMRMERNPFYRRGNAKRPPVEVLFIDEDQTALNLYEKKELSFLRRLPTTYIAKYRDRPDFLQIPVARFDYIGFGDELKNQPDLRAALSYSADYPELARLYDALGVPGCPSLPEKLLEGDHCIRFDLERAKAAFAKVPDELKKRRLKMMFSRLGGDDIKKGMEWYQAQWKKNLGIQVDLEQTEQGVYLDRLRSNPPDIFRKGVGLERPTCLSALETFARGGSENFLKLNDPVFEALIEKLSAVIDGRTARSPSTEAAKEATKDAKKICGEGVQRLLDQNLIIPQGRIHFTLLADPRFKGWHLNEMNQLDLSALSFKP